MATDIIARGLASNNKKQTDNFKNEIVEKGFSRIREVTFKTPKFEITKDNLKYDFSFARAAITAKVDGLKETYDDYDIVDIYIKSINTNATTGTSANSIYEKTEARIEYPYVVLNNKKPTDIFYVHLEFPFYEFTKPVYHEETGTWTMYADNDNLGVSRDTDTATYPQDFFLITVVVNLK